jgi:hypothetical protein
VTIFVVLAMKPPSTKDCSDESPVYALIQAAAQSWCLLMAGMARSEPPMKAGIVPLPLAALGITNEPIWSLSAALPSLPKTFFICPEVS